ncbi:two-component system, sensor histidine kinase YesM [Lachnospiraceae bacterium]|nr:two-component system, sensor histidine kinase YesM [Lachnospiraceae bacterium]
MMTNKSIRSYLILIFIITSLIPILILGIFSFGNIFQMLNNNSKTLIDNNLERLDSNLHISLDAYNDVMYQIYTDDSIVSGVEKIDAGIDEALTINQMRRFLNSLMNSKSYIRAITVITPGENVITYDQMSPRLAISAWLPNFDMSQDELYADVISDSKTHTYSTQFATSFANDDYYTFQIAHRIVNYRNISKDCGIVILSIDEKFLEELCSSQKNSENDFTYIEDKEGRRLCFITKNPVINRRNSKVYTYTDDELGWTFYYVRDMSELGKALRRQMWIMFMLVLFVCSFAALFTLNLTGNLATAITSIVKAMQEAEKGNLKIRAELESTAPADIKILATGFNNMVAELNCTREREVIANEKQKEAEIRALEAQINPHFLYNTLDSINWLAIDRDEYDISNAINSLAAILRYAITDSNKEVPIEKEIEWLKKYVFLQQFRTKNSFDCRIDIKPEVNGVSIHKLLIQPFVENSIIHGFENIDRKAMLTIEMHTEDEKLVIKVIDNGSGMPEELVNAINEGSEEITGDRTHIGMSNVITRMRIYYGSEASITAIAAEGEGTEIVLKIPFLRKVD